MLKNKCITYLLATVVLTLIFSGCGTLEASSTDQQVNASDTLTIAQGADAKSLDPHATNDQPSSRVSKQIYSRLVEMDEDMKIIPGVAQTWNYIDDKTVDFKLREGVKFHNGEELKASDVKFTLDRMLSSKKVAHIIEAVEGVEVIDAHTVRIKTKEPFSPLLAHLSHTAASILNQKAVEAAGDTYGQNPVGTGPYKFVKWDAGDKIMLEAFEDYFAGPASVNKVVFRNITDGTNRTIGLETGEIDISYDVEPIDKQRVKDQENLQFIEAPALSYEYIGMNNKKPPFDNVKVRQAVNHAVDVEAIIKVVLEGAGKKANSPIGPGVFGYDADVKGYNYDVAQAKKLLAEAGYPNGFKTTIWTNDNPVRMQIAQIVQAQLADIGIEAVIEPLEWGSYLERTSKGEHDMYILGWTTVTGDADYGLYAMYHSSQHGGAGNRSFYTNPEVDQLLEQGRMTVDENKRKEIYAKAQKIIASEAPDAMLYYKTQNVGAQNRVHNFKLHPAGHHNIFNVTFK